VVTKLMYAAIAAALLAPVPALAGGEIEPPGYYGGGPYEDYEDYAPVVRRKVIIERPVIIRKRVVVERPVVVVERPIIIEKRVVVERPLVVKKRHVFVERPLKYGYGPRYGKRHHRKRFHDGYRKDYGYGYGRHFDDEDGDFHHRGYGPY
jgi:hypothetical protein